MPPAQGPPGSWARAPSPVTPCCYRRRDPAPRGGPPSPPRPRPRASDPPLSRQAQLRSAALESCRRGPGKGEETPLSRPSGAGSSAQAASRPVSRDVTSVSPAPGEGGRLAHVGLAPCELRKTADLATTDSIRSQDAGFSGSGRRGSGTRGGAPPWGLDCGFSGRLLLLAP